MNEFRYHRSDNKLGRLSRSRETVAEMFAPSGFTESDHGRHVERFTEKGMADFGKPWSVFNADARLMLTRIKSGKSHSLPSISEAVKVEKSGHQMAIFLKRKRRCHNEENYTKAGRYSKEFREEAVKLVVVQDLSVPEASMRLDLPKSTINNWVRASKAGKLSSIGKNRRKLSDTELELARLKRELAQVKMKRDILKKTAAYFTKESI